MASSTTPPRKRGRRTLSDLTQFIALSIVAGFVTAGLLIPPTAAVGLTANASINWFKGLPDDLSEGPLSQPSVVLASDGEQIATFYSENRDEVPLDQISQNMIDAQLSIEDDDFYEHGGVDAMGIGRAILNNIVNPNSRQGASTITQQYVNNLLIDSATQSGGDPYETMGANKGLMDKVKEMKLAISMEQNKSKDEILNGYLNIVNYGGSNYGVQAAAQHYWGVDASQLNIQQSALLAGMVQSPAYYDPVANPEAATERRNTVLYTMLQNDRITQAEYDAAVASGLDLDVHDIRSGCSAAEEAPYFCDYIQNLVLQDDSFGDTPEDRQVQLTRGGLTIQTTLDMKAQRAAQEQVERTQPLESNTDRVNTSLVSVEPGTGNILSMAQNSNYAGEEGTSNTLYNYNVESALGGTAGFAPGSTFKPFTLAEWIKEGNGVNARVDARRLSYPAGTEWNASCVDGGKVVNPGANGAWSFQNATPGYQRQMTVNEGIYNSINSALYATAEYVDLCGIGDTAEALGVTEPSQDNVGQRQRIATEQSLASLIGTSQVTPISMANAFATFASDGMYCQPRAIESVTDRRGQAIEMPASQCNRALDEDVARGVNFVLKEVLKRGSGYERDIDLDDASAAKTGTTDNSTQTWMVGYTRGISTASWVGNADEQGRSLNNLNIGGQSRDYVDGSSFAGTQWQRYMNTVKGDHNTDKFTDPSEKVRGDDIESDKA
ncbi:transglycosylase domain-containing protein [Rothia sp. AR01]|uniref:Transglycosylase domain-containing protein n=1 Tax=Rothia santali TaxID=2949643 RepID=A0A9X2HCD7_9MICC|nr:transglycosylase domain-containing protein [Rothia santali]MCP3425127.1 transglycosylase domain-containing protein [Rothia santali]